MLIIFLHIIHAVSFLSGFPSRIFLQDKCLSAVQPLLAVINDPRPDATDAIRFARANALSSYLKVMACFEPAGKFLALCGEHMPLKDADENVRVMELLADKTEEFRALGGDSLEQMRDIIRKCVRGFCDLPLEWVVAAAETDCLLVLRNRCAAAAEKSGAMTEAEVFAAFA